MALLNILEYPDPRLRTKAAPVLKVDKRVQGIIADMFETMYAAPGIGLAASQVDIHERIVVIDVSEDKTEPLVFINPEITVLEGEPETMQEGCLSVPGFYEDVTRIEHCLVKALDRDGKPFEMECRGLLAVCIQHEIDHLEGILYVDYISPLKRNRIKEKLEKKHKTEARK
ncbi:MAG: hypothetical protein RL217_217 [Pseudomonadota bacterium]|jgi:peptide deformylase